MDALIMGIVISLLVEGIKWVNSKTKNTETSKTYILVAVAVFSLASALVYTRVPKEVLETWAQIGMVAVGFFETVYKLILAPAFNKASDAIMK